MSNDDHQLPSGYGVPSSIRGLSSPTPFSAGNITIHMPTPLTIDIDGRELTVQVAPHDKPIVRQRLKELIRREKRRASNAGNAANTAQQIGIGIGGALAVTGGVALVTVSAPFFLGAAIATGLGTLIASGGLVTSHWMNAKKFSHEEKIDRFQDAVEELR